MFIKYEGSWEDVALDRHCIIARRMDTDDLTYARVLDDSHDMELRRGEAVITEGEFAAGAKAIEQHNRMLTEPTEAVRTPETDPPLTKDEIKAIRAILKNR